eukprot:g13612.t1
MHEAAYDGSTKRAVALLSRGSINIDRFNPQGFTPLMYAAQEGRSRVVRIQLSSGADVSVARTKVFEPSSIRRGYRSIEPWFRHHPCLSDSTA